MASIRQTIRLAKEIVYPSAPFMPTRKWNDAERTHKIAAVLHLEIRARLFVLADAFNSEIIGTDPTGMQQLGSRPPLQRGHVLRKLHFVLGADDQIDALHLLQHRRARLGITARDRHERVRGTSADLPDNAPAVGFSALCNRTCVQHKKVGWLAGTYQFIPTATELVAQDSRFGLIQATPYCMERSARHNELQIITTSS